MKKLICFTLLIAICISSTSCFIRPLRSQRITSGNDVESSVKVDTSEETEGDEDKDEKESSESSESDHADQQESVVNFEKDFGTYSVSSGWEESESHSTSDKFFYIPQGNDSKSYSDNVSVRTGENGYAEDDVMGFKDAILRQLTTQFSEYPDATMTGNGTFTKNDYALLTFTITGFDDDTTVTFYYIVGDHKYCEVYLTCKDDPEDAEQTAQMIVDSFVWAEEE